MLGLILWEMIAGRRLFVGETDYATFELARNALVPPLTPSVPDVDPELETIVGTAVAEDPRDRHQTVWELREDLADYLSSCGLTSTAYDLRAIL